MSGLKFLIACERSGRVRDALIARGYKAVSCDIEPTDVPGPHYRGDVRGVLYEGWDCLISFPPCTYLCASGMHWTTRGLRDPQLTEDALAFVRLLLAAPIPHKAMENPRGVISTRIRKPDQVIQPWMFGEDASKATCLWLENLPPLAPTNCVPGRKVMHRGKLVERWANQTDSGQNSLSPSPSRAKERSTTYQGVADAIADQWGSYVAYHAARDLLEEVTP